MTAEVLTSPPADVTFLTIYGWAAGSATTVRFSHPRFGGARFVIEARLIGSSAGLASMLGHNNPLECPLQCLG